MDVTSESESIVEELTTGSEYVLWIKIAKSYTNDDKDILLVCTYIPPISSPFYNNNEFELCEHEVSLMASRFDLLYMISYNKRSDWLIDYQCEANLHVVCTIIKHENKKKTCVPIFYTYIDLYSKCS